MEPANRKLIRPSFNEAKAEVKSQRPQPRGGPKRTSPPEQTNAENFYYLKQMQSKTPMSIVLRDGEILKGVIEWYDKDCLKVNREGAPNLLVFKSNIKYMHKALAAPFHRMQGKVAVLTGGTSGIGEAAATKLASMGARLVLVARDASRAEATLKRLQKISSAAANVHTAHLADLSLVADTRRVAREIAAAEPRIDVLINEAGLIGAKRQVTSEGYELTFATNHLAYFALTHGLLPRLLSSAPARIVNTASDVHRGAKLDFDDLQSQHGYSGFEVYAKSKLANVLFTNELARRLSGKGVTANSLHPGVVASRFGLPREGQGGDPSSARFLSAQGISPEEGAETIVYLASSVDAAQATGQYFSQSRAVAPSKEAQDRAVAQKLWEESERLVGIEYGN